MQLPCEAIVYRVLKRNPVDENGQLKERDFILKPGDREDGLSLFTSRDGAEQCRRKLDRVDGLATLHVGRIRDLCEHPDVLLSLDVVDVPSGIFPDHAALVNLPDPHTGRAEDADRAETLARILAAMARPVPEMI